MGVYITNKDNLGANAHDGLQTSGTALPVNSVREGFQIQNQDTGVLYCYFGTGCSSSKYHFTLKGGTGAADGTGGSFNMLNGLVWRGAFTVASGGTPSYTIVEF